MDQGYDVGPRPTTKYIELHLISKSIFTVTPGQIEDQIVTVKWK